jgi:hypothetical protein
VVVRITFDVLIVNGVFKMDMTVRGVTTIGKPANINVGEIVEKSTRMLTPEEAKVLDQDFVGKNGEKRKIEVRNPSIYRLKKWANFLLPVHHGPTKAEKVASIRDQVARTRSQV